MTEEIKQLTKAQIRAKKYYETHKEQILAKAKAKRIPIIIPRKYLSYDDIIFIIKNNLDMKDTTKEIYIKTLRRINMLLQYDNYMDIDKIDDTIKIINKSAEQYSINTIKLIYQTLLKIIDLLDLSIDKKSYIEQFELLKIKSVDENKIKQETMILPTFDAYIKNIKNNFGIDSKMYLLVKLYDIITLRDDFGDLIIVNKVSEIKPDVNKNYIYVPEKNGICTIRINSYKTDNKYGIIHKTLNVEISKLIKKYMTNNNITYGDALFGKNVGSYISQMNKKISPDYEGVSWLRHIKITDLLNKDNVTPEEKLKLANEMMHSPLVQDRYKRTN